MNTPSQDMGHQGLPTLLGLEITRRERGLTEGHLRLRPELMAPNGYLHAGTVVTLADSCAGYGCIASLPDGAQSFTTIELKSNFLGTARDGEIHCRAVLAHGGRTTQVWDAEVRHGDKVIAMFRCTQMILYPR